MVNRKQNNFCTFGIFQPKNIKTQFGRTKCLLENACVKFWTEKKKKIWVEGQFHKVCVLGEVERDEDILRGKRKHLKMHINNTEK